MRLAVRHETQYRYESPLAYSIQQLRLTPYESMHQRVLQWHLEAPEILQPVIDPFGNRMHNLSVQRPLRAIQLVAQGVVEVDSLVAGELPVSSRDHISPLVFTVPGPLTEPDERLRQFALDHIPPSPSREDMLALCETVRSRIRYATGITGTASTASHALELGMGVCQDSAHVSIAAFHVHHIPCRYVSGYFYPGDRSEFASHAWIDVWLADRNTERGGHWISLDPTHGGFATDRHIRLAVGRDYESAAPIRGVRSGGGEEHLQVQVIVSPA